MKQLNKVTKGIAKTLSEEEQFGNVRQAFLKSTGIFRSVLFSNPAGWGNRTAKKLDGIRNDIDLFVQSLNDKFTSPSGEKAEKEDTSK